MSARNFECTNDKLIRDWKQLVRYVWPEKMPTADFEKLLLLHPVIGYKKALFVCLPLLALQDS